MQTQWRAGGMGIIGLDYQTVYSEAKRIGIELTICTMKKIKALERAVLEKSNEKQAKKGKTNAGPNY